MGTLEGIIEGSHSLMSLLGTSQLFGGLTRCDLWALRCLKAGSGALGWYLRVCLLEVESNTLGAGRAYPELILAKGWESGVRRAGSQASNPNPELYKPLSTTSPQKQQNPLKAKSSETPELLQAVPYTLLHRALSSTQSNPKASEPQPFSLPGFMGPRL